MELLLHPEKLISTEDDGEALEEGIDGPSYPTYLPIYQVQVCFCGKTALEPGLDLDKSGRLLCL